MRATLADHASAAIDANPDRQLRTALFLVALLELPYRVDYRKSGAHCPEIKAPREQGRKLASELKAVLGDAGKREQALKEARGKVAELGAGLARKTADLKRKSGELKKLAEESAHRAAA